MKSEKKRKYRKHGLPDSIWVLDLQPHAKVMYAWIHRANRLKDDRLTSKTAMGNGLKMGTHQVNKYVEQLMELGMIEPCKGKWKATYHRALPEEQWLVPMWPHTLDCKCIICDSSIDLDIPDEESPYAQEVVKLGRPSALLTS